MFRIKLLLISTFLITPLLTLFAQDKGWKQYTSSMAGFSVNYPSDWRIDREEAKGKIWRVTFVSPGMLDDDVFEHDTITICSKSKSDSFESLDRCAEHHLLIKDSENISEKKVLINGIEVLKRENKKKNTSKDSNIDAFFSTKNRDFQLSGNFRAIFNLERYIPVFDQMLKTIQVLDERETLTYRNDKFDFALTYPTSWKSCPIVALQNKEEELLLLVPDGKLCNRDNYISVSRVTKFSNEKNNRNLEEFLQDKIFTKTIPYIEFGNIHAAMGEKTDKKHIYRERYFYTNYPQTYELLKISEMYKVANETCQKEAKEILTTARRFLKFQ